MALPTLIKTWQFNVNNTVASATRTNAHKGFLWELVQALTGFASNPWTIISSNRWDSEAGLTWNSPGIAHSWIVLENVDGVQLVIDLYSTSTSRWDVVASTTGGFAGGTDTNRPTATDEFAISASFYITTSGVSNISIVFHVLHSDDGTQTWVLWCPSDTPGRVHGAFACCKLENAVDGWLEPYWLKATSQGSTIVSAAALRYTQSFEPFGTSFAWASGARASCILSTLSASNDQAGDRYTTINEMSSTWDMFPVSVISDTLGARGLLGWLPDVYAVSDGLGQGKQFPATGEQEWAVVGDIAVPWDGSTIDLNGGTTADVDADVHMPPQTVVPAAAAVQPIIVIG